MSATIDRARALLRQIQEPTHGIHDLKTRRRDLMAELALEVAPALIDEAQALEEAADGFEQAAAMWQQIAEEREARDAR